MKNEWRQSHTDMKVKGQGEGSMFSCNYFLCISKLRPSQTCPKKCLSCNSSMLDMQILLACIFTNENENAYSSIDMLKVKILK